MHLKIIWRSGVAQLHGTIAGQRVRKSTRARDPETAERIRAEEEARLTRAALYGAQNEATFADACALYLDPKEGRSSRYVTPILKEFGKRRLATITPGDIKSLAHKLYPHAKNATKNRSVIIPARAIINFGAEAGLCRSLRVKGFKAARVLRAAGNRAWVDAFMAHAVNRRVRVMALFAWVTAARTGEMVLLEPEDVDLDGKRAVLDASLTKTRQPYTYYLTDELVAELRLLEPRRINYGRGPLRVFGYADRRGPIEPWRQTCERAGIPYLPPHQAGRHGFATEMIVRQGVDPVTTAKLGRWDDPKVLLNTYSHAEGLSDKIEELMGGRTRFSGKRLAHVKLHKGKKAEGTNG
jgi:integrase